MTIPARARSLGAFLPLYALANAGGAISYYPVLSLLVPLKVEAIAADMRLELLSTLTIVGGIVASGANIAFGAASDRSFRRLGSRRGWIAGGLLLTIVALAALAAAATPATMIGAIILFQLAVNMLLAPLAATMADVVPPDRQGLAGGLVALGIPAGALAAAAVTAMNTQGEAARLAVVAATVAAFVLPLVATRTVPHAAAPAAADRHARRRDLIRVSLGRLLVQIANNALFTYLLFYFEALPEAGVGAGVGASAGAPVAARIARLTTLSLLIAMPLGPLAGRWSDTLGRRKPLLLATAGLAAGGLAIMAARGDRASAELGYALFAIASTIFLGLQTGLLMQVLPSADARGRDLGIVNLANTAPALISSALAWVVVGRFGFATLMALLAALVALGGLLTLSVRSQA